MSRPRGKDRVDLHYLAGLRCHHKKATASVEAKREISLVGVLPSLEQNGRFLWMPAQAIPKGRFDEKRERKVACNH
eukprot:CCRYP_004851-RA/>CCRYP_004851-RA protein AED:0.44 eAED:0.61 QI:0/0/0.5/1/0/0/2/159/75